MRKEQFIDFIQNPHLLGELNINELKSLVEAYPFFQTAHLLYAKALSNINHVDYYNGLKKTSILVGDRKVLYKLITKNKPTESTSVTTKISTPVTEIKVPTNITQSKIIEQAYPEIKLESNTSNTNNQTKNNDIKINFEELKTKQIVPEIKDKPNKVELIFTPKQNLNQETIIPKVQEPTPEKIEKVEPVEHNQEVQDKNVDDVVLNRVVNAYIEKEFLKIDQIDKPYQKTKIEIDPEEGKQILTQTLNEPHSFSQWLKLLSNPQTTQKETTVQAEEKNLAKPLVDDKQQQQINKLEKERQDKIIENIISTKPSISKIKQTAEFFTPAAKAKESIERDETLVTETLAWILEKQGKFPDAIRAYDMLSLKFPEKSVYFASLISKIRIKQKQK